MSLIGDGLKNKGSLIGKNIKEKKAVWLCETNYYTHKVWSSNIYIYIYIYHGLFYLVTIMTGCAKLSLHTINL